MTRGEETIFSKPLHQRRKVQVGQIPGTDDGGFDWGDGEIEERRFVILLPLIIIVVTITTGAATTTMMMPSVDGRDLVEEQL